MAEITPKRPNSSYWQKRFKALEESQHADSMVAYQNVEPYFTEMERDIDKQIEVWLNRIADNNGVSIAEARKMLSKDELKEFHWTVEQYIKAGKENALDQRWMKQLENASAKAHITRLEAIKIQIQQAAEKAFGNETDAVDAAIRASYEKGYYRTAYIIQKGTGVGSSFARINTDELDTLIRKPWAADGQGFSDRIWSRKTNMVNTLQNAVIRTCAMGEAPNKAAKRMEQFVSSATKNSKYAARRLIQTESAYYSSVAKKKCFENLDVEQYEIVATLDMRTDDFCADMDGEHYPVKDMDPGVTAPPFHANCRCTTCPYFNDEFTKDEKRNSRDLETGKSVQEVPADMTYKEWKAQFVDNNDNTQLLNDSITNMQSEAVGKSVGAKFKNYDIMDLATGDKYHLAEGSKLQDKEVFAGKGSHTPYRNAQKYADKYGGKPEDWQHVKARGVIHTDDGDIPVEIHWSQCEGIGKKDLFIKRWLE